MKSEIHPREKRLAVKQQIDNELTAARTQLTKLRAERDAMALATRRGELVKRHDMKLQLGFLLTGLRQRLMSLSYSLPRQLAGRNEHEIGRIVDYEVRSALKDIAGWPAKLATPGWQEEIDADSRPPAEVAGNGEDKAATAQHERRNAKRRAKYAEKSKGV